MDERQIATQWIEKRFKDGTYTIPNHVATMLGAMDTSQLTYHEALDAANGRTLSSYLNSKQSSAIQQHFARGRSRGSD